MRVIVDLSSKSFDRIQQLIDEGRYPSLQKFIAVAVENQLGLEEQLEGQHGGNDQETEQVEKQLPTSPTKQPDLSIGEKAESWAVGGIEWLRRHRPSDLGYQPNAGDWLWGQVNNVLAIKFVTRALLLTQAEVREREVPGSHWLQRLRDSAQSAGKWLRSLDDNAGRNRVDAWSKSFPSSNEDSAQRFARQYAGEVRKTGRVLGALPWLGLARWRNDGAGETDKLTIGLTELGLGFAQLENPVFDQGQGSGGGAQEKLSEQERVFYRSRIAEISEPEREAFLCIGSILVDEEKIPAAALRERVGEEYSNWSSTQASTNASGALARMDDVGLLRRYNPGTAKAAYDASQQLHEYVEQVT